MASALHYKYQTNELEISTFGSNMLKRLGKVLTLSSISLTAMAAGNSTVVENLNTNKKLLSVILSNSLSSSLESGADHELVNSTSILSSYKLNELYSLSNTFAFDKDLQNDRELSIRDALFTLSRKTDVGVEGSYFRLKGSLAAPLSKGSRKDSDLITSVTLGATFGMGLDSILKGLSFYYLPDAKISFYKYQTARHSGESNNQYRVLQRLIIGYQIADKFSLSFDNIYYRNWTFEGTTTDVFNFDQSLTYQATNDFSISIGHSIGGNALDINGVDSNVKLFDQHSSSVYTSFEYRY